MTTTARSLDLRRSIGSKVAEVRKRAGYTQQAAASSVTLSLAGYKAKEHGRSVFDGAELFVLAQVFGVEISEMFPDRRVSAATSG